MPPRTRPGHTQFLPVTHQCPLGKQKQVWMELPQNWACWGLAGPEAEIKYKISS